jgi:hypothetical protein
MLRLSPPDRVTPLGQVMVYALHGSGTGLHRGSILVELDFTLFIFLNRHILLCLRDKVLLYPSLITAHILSSYT